LREKNLQKIISTLSKWLACLGYSPPYNYPKQIKRKVEVEGGEQNRREEKKKPEMILFSNEVKKICQKAWLL
jgi:hypothetical protein